MKEFAIQTEDLSFSYSKKHKILNKVNINVPKGSIYGFLGPNGAGKSTTMQLLTGVLVSEKDDISIFGKEIKSQMPEMFHKMGALVESPSLYMHLSAIDNLRCVTTLKSIDESKIYEVLELVGLLENGNQKVKKFSLGMKQRLAIAMTLLGDPELLLLDEPVNGLDPTGMTEVRELLVNLNKEKGITIFISSHLLDEIQKMCTYIGIIHKGEIQFEGTMEELASRNTDCTVLLEIGESEKHASILEEAYEVLRQESENQFKISLSSKEDIPEVTKFLIQNNIPVYQLRIEEGLENWFLTLTK
ncbi:ATP-binding cassette domain-containing protein [Flavicella sediminum]|uniref:ATP-binding cassette domain-containing protein n=1 Tax=Flavicella sediminum TaxID=2585141 RepID=UPI001123917B|nr:ATP-binding cassette domain-containing protein [Flavicella sediminum]